MRIPLRVAVVLTVAWASPATAGGMYFEVAYPPSEAAGELRLGVTYTLWVPDGVPTLRGVIVHQHGCGVGASKGGETAAYDLHWQALARKWDCALLGPSFHQVEGQKCESWFDPRNGSDKTFSAALKWFAAESRHPELDAVPWCLWGHSGGGYWASLMLALHPERVVAVWCRSGTAFYDPAKPAGVELPAAAFGVPLVLNPGVKEKGHKQHNIAWTRSEAMFRAYREKGGPAAFAPDPRTTHECGDSRYLAIPFFDACLALRLPDKVGGVLKPVDPAKGWLAAAVGDVPVPVASFKGKPEDAVWLPSEAVAKAWAEYVRTGATADTTPPPAPTGVKVATADGTTTITWDADADFESGLGGFVVQRDGKDVGRVPEKPVGRFGRPLFQTMSYHDTPEKPLPAMRFVDKPGDGAPHEYRVIAVNGVGLRSEPAKP